LERGGKNMKISKRWIKKNVGVLNGFGGQITLDNFEEYVGKGMLESTLTRLGKGRIEHHESGSKFLVLIPGLGWAEAWGKE
jgi:hypothetical protein